MLIKRFINNIIIGCHKTSATEKFRSFSIVFSLSISLYDVPFAQ